MAPLARRDGAAAERGRACASRLHSAASPSMRSGLPSPKSQPASPEPQALSPKPEVPSPEQQLAALVAQIIELTPRLSLAALEAASSDIMQAACATFAQSEAAGSLYMYLQRQQLELVRVGRSVRLAGLKDGFEGRIGTVEALRPKGVVTVGLPGRDRSVLHVSLWNVVPGPELPELQDEVWCHIWSFLPRRLRYNCVAGVCAQWRRAAFSDATLFSRIIVISDTADAVTEAQLLRDYEPVNVASVGALAQNGHDSASTTPYLVADYLPLRPFQLAHVPDTSWVLTLVVAEPRRAESALGWPHTRLYPGQDGFQEQKSKLDREHFERYWPAVLAVAAMRFPALETLRISTEGLQ